MSRTACASVSPGATKHGGSSAALPAVSSAAAVANLVTTSMSETTPQTPARSCAWSSATTTAWIRCAARIRATTRSDVPGGQVTRPRCIASCTCVSGQVGLGCDACHRAPLVLPSVPHRPVRVVGRTKRTVAGIYESSTAEQRVDVDELERLQLGAAARTERERDLRDRGRVGRLDDVDEVVLAERRPLVQDLRPELLDVLVDLAEAARVRLQRLHALRRQRRQHQIGRHQRLLLARGADPTRAAWSK